MSYVTGAIYPQQDRIRMGVTQSEALDAYREGGASVALGYMTPNARELRELQQTFNLHELALEDASHGHQRAKLES